ncbi:CHK kinase-like domain-containing protein [Caenorhabditis elegans]|uniref:CHK kinase-like domain-containing protein n=1 Tax=Caenorhabditis elegans TaxID=6239 RepID=Q19034_CAEEL|nr:CHK kinase-like domain-containing protein [Caenorhabditis elegans]CCD68596.3 CHK kinase-like domain-containing protein [Caenorhabditis elegans]|eukprot:NP_505430.3 Uncharacterized protein CELE_E02C12.10 [Caenorhabditis elegans]
MSLYEAADGILETHVTWKDVEEAMQISLGTKAKFGENKKSTNISDLKGFMSKIAMIEPHWVGVENDKVLPNKFTVKISSQLAFAVLSKTMKFGGVDGFDEEKLKTFGNVTRECHNREVAAYKMLIKFNNSDIPFTKVYHLKPFDDANDLKGFMIMEFIPNVHSIPMYEAIPADDLISLVRGIATFAALGETSEGDKTSAGGPEFIDMMFEEVLSMDQIEGHFDSLRILYGSEHLNTVETSITILRQYRMITKKYTKISELLGFKLVLNHGDLWQSNMLHCLDEFGNLKLKAIIDWQGVSTLPPGLDLSRLLMGCLSAHERRERGLEMLKLYHETFNQVLGKELFSFQELQDSYNLYYPMMAMLLLPIVSSFLDNSPISEVEKSQARIKNQKNMIAMMEDLIEVHDYNMKNHPDFLKL